MAARMAAILGLAALLGGALPPPAQAVNVKRTPVIKLLTTAQVESALQKAGASEVEVTTDDQGDPMINASYDGLNFAVLFYNCEGDGCEWGQFRASFERDDMSTDDKLRTINEWNRDWVFGKAYVNENDDLLLEHPFIVRDGISRGNLAHNADEWLVSLKRYAKELGWE